MKIDKRNPRHWYLLGLQAGWSFLAVLMRPLRRCFSQSGSRRRIILLYGHQFNGNLAAIYREWERNHQHVLSIHFLALDPDYAVDLRRRNIRALTCTRFSDMKLLWRTDAMITDHGLHSMAMLKKLTDIKFVDVWHGIPFKGYGEKDMAMLSGYAAIWTTSEHIKRLYSQKMNLPAEIIQVTGYARTDQIFAPPANLLDEISASLELDGGKSYLLYAPTWQNTRSNFEYTQKTIENLCRFADKHNTVIIYRPHLNSTQSFSYGNVRTLSASQYPDTENLLLIADILVTDWSSIAFDYLLREKPTLFMDTAAPFESFTVDPEYRYGEIVPDPDGLPEILERITADPDYYLSKHKDQIEKTRQFVYEEANLGNSANRCLQEAIRLTA